MYVGELHDFFYKPKSWIFQQPKFNQKIDSTFINSNGKIFKINELTGEMTLCNIIPKKPKIPKNSKNSLKKNRLNIDNSKTVSSGNQQFKELFSELSNNIENKNNKNNSINLENKNLIINNYIEKNNNKSINITPTNNNKTFFSKNKTLNPILLSKKNNYSPNINNIKNKEINNKNKTILYYNKTNKKYIKPTIAFGQKIIKSISFNKKKIEYKNFNKSYNKNLLYLIHKQHNNNLNKEGRINDKIYDKKISDNIIFKNFRDQIFKEKIINGLKKKYNFYEDKNNKELKIPQISHYNYNFYRGYSFSDNKRLPIHHKLFFQYIYKDRLKQKEEYEQEKKEIFNQ